MLTLTIHTDGAAFTVESNGPDNGAPNAGPEVARLLRQVAEDIEAHGITGGTLRDANGAGCGAWSLDEPAPADVDQDTDEDDAEQLETCERCGDDYDPDAAGTDPAAGLCASCTSSNADRVTL